MITMPWKTDGAVERGVTPRPHKDLDEGAGALAPLAHNGYFQRRPHLLSADLRAAFFAIGTLAAAALTYMVVAKLVEHPIDLHCHPGDRTTTNGRDLCPPHEVRR